MVDFEYWFENVVGYCEFVVSQLPNRVWVDREKGLTSAYDVNEFLEQVLGDLDLETLIPAFAETLRSRDLYEAFLNFCSALLQVEQFLETTECGAEQLLASSAWANLKAAAHQVVCVPGARANLWTKFQSDN